MPPSGVDYASEFLNGYAPEYVSSPSKTYNNLSSFPCFATFAILPSGKSDAENSEIVVNKGNVEYLDFSFASGKMAKVAKHDA